MASTPMPKRPSRSPSWHIRPGARGRRTCLPPPEPGTLSCSEVLRSDGNGLRLRHRHARGNRLADLHVRPVVSELPTAIQTHDVGSRSARERKRGALVKTTEQCVENRLKHGPYPPGYLDSSNRQWFQSASSLEAIDCAIKHPWRRPFSMKISLVCMPATITPAR